MKLEEVLEKILRDSDETDDWGNPGRDDDAELLAPVIEKALRAERLYGYKLGFCDADAGIVYDQGGRIEGVKRMSPYNGIAAIVEGL